MSGHAFQVFIEDDVLRTSLAAIRRALADDGRFAFETRNPLVREWEQWTPDKAEEVTNAAGAVVRCEYEVQTPLEGDLVRFSATFTSPSWSGPRVSWSTLRFLTPELLSQFLSDAGLA